MKMLIALALLFPTMAAHAQTHDSDFPDEMRAINQCYVAMITNHQTAKELSIAQVDANLKTCVEAKGFRFCESCRIFHTRGELCKDDHENGIHRATCWRSRDSVAQ